MSNRVKKIKLVARKSIKCSPQCQKQLERYKCSDGFVRIVDLVETFCRFGCRGVTFTDRSGYYVTLYSPW